jgi:hypothetical protein
MKNLLTHSATLSVVLFLGIKASAANIITFDGLGPANTWTNYGNWFGYSMGTSMTVGQRFTAAAGGLFDELYTSMTPGGNPLSDVFTLRLCADNSRTPGSTLWERTYTSWPAGPLFHLQSLGGPWLYPGQSYWLEADKPVGIVGLDNWWANDQGYLGTFGYAQDGQWRIWDNVDVRGLRILVNTVPEPSALVLLLPLALVFKHRLIRGTDPIRHGDTNGPGWVCSPVK